MTVLLEAMHFLWAHRRASRAYVQWRLGTVYGSFNRETGEPRSVRELLRDVWRDRQQVVKFLRWRRQMRGLTT